MSLWVRILMFTADPADVASAVDEHRRQLAALEADGRLRLAGVLGDDDGLLDVFDAPDRHAAEEILRGSPLVERGLAAWTLRRFEQR